MDSTKAFKSSKFFEMPVEANRLYVFPHVTSRINDHQKDIEVHRKNYHVMY